MKETIRNWIFVSILIVIFISIGTVFYFSEKAPYMESNEIANVWIFGENWMWLYSYIIAGFIFLIGMICEISNKFTYNKSYTNDGGK